MDGQTDGWTDRQTILQRCEDAIIINWVFPDILMIYGCLNAILRMLKVDCYDGTMVKKVGRKPICDGMHKRLIYA